MNVNLERLRQDLEGIDFFFTNFGHYYRFNVVTQMMLHLRDKKDLQFDKVCKESYEINRALVFKKEEFKKEIHKPLQKP